MILMICLKLMILIQLGSIINNTHFFIFYFNTSHKNCHLIVNNTTFYVGTINNYYSIFLINKFKNIQLS